MQLERSEKVIDGSALARRHGTRITRVPEQATPTDPNRALETARRTVISQAAARSRAQRIQDGQSLRTLQATGGPPAGARSTSSLLVTGDDNRRRTSLFDLPRSGAAVIDRMRGQVRPSSPLSGLLGGNDGAGPLSRFTGIDKSDPLAGLNRTPMSLTAAQSLTSSLQSSFNRIDNASRSLMQLGNPLRMNGGFGLQLPVSSLNLLG